MTTPTPVWPFPYDLVPGHHQPMTELALREALPPLLKGTHVLLEALALAAFHETSPVKDTHHALTLLAAQVELAAQLVTRWDVTYTTQHRAAPEGGPA